MQFDELKKTIQEVETIVAQASVPAHKLGYEIQAVKIKTPEEQNAAVAIERQKALVGTAATILMARGPMRDIARIIVWSDNREMAAERLKGIAMTQDTFAKDELSYFGRDGDRLILNDELLDWLLNLPVTAYCGLLAEPKVASDEKPKDNSPEEALPDAQKRICKVVSNHTFRQKVEDTVHVSLGCVFVKKEAPPAFNPTGQKPRPDTSKRARGVDGTIFLKGLSSQLHLANSWPIFFMTLFARLPADIAIVRSVQGKSWDWELTDLGLSAMKKRDIAHIQMFAGAYADIFATDTHIPPHKSDADAVALANSFVINEEAIARLRTYLTPPLRPSSKIDAMRGKFATSIKDKIASVSGSHVAQVPTDANPAPNLQRNGLQGQRIV